MKRLLTTIFATSLALGLAACESEAPKNDKTAKADAKADDAKADDAKADDAAEAEDADADADADADEADEGTPADEGDAPDDTPADEGEDDLDGYDPRVSKAARIAAQINEDPDKADEMLAAADLDREQLDALMYEIANDPDLTAQYRMARGI